MRGLSRGQKDEDISMAASEGSPLASENERLILDIVRRHEPIARAAITAHTNLTQQSVHRLWKNYAASASAFLCTWDPSSRIPEDPEHPG